ncbi:MAG: septum formation protein, partial [Gammaproteobacteria bacterium]
LIERLTLDVRAMAPDIDETSRPDESAHDYVKRLAIEKAHCVYERLANAPTEPGTVGAKTLVIGSDQCAVLGQTIVGKPGSIAGAIAQLQASSGRTVQFLTGLAVQGQHGVEADVVAYSVRFRTLTMPEIERYVQRELPLDCAGGFKSEGLGVTLFEQMSGDDPTALVGLPLIRLCEMLRRQGVALP